ncbi:MAG: nicotinate-nucleotide adenylyltransferase [Acidobacteriaceae bacterium]|jgi:nicotinate-nucleotide adenylyltransferase|nr:nicotinate-nucleotide adenylyltransferase [Acidobacteriaceae bacterium]
MNRRLGILGGTFDPIHRGHLDLGTAAHEALRLTSVLVLPSHVPPHRPQTSASAFHRFAMAAMAVSGQRGWEVSDLELNAPGPSYTSHTLQRLLDTGYMPGELFFVIGADAFADIESWRDYPELLSLANFAVVSRPGHSVRDLPMRVPRLADRFANSTNAARGETTSIFLIDALTADVSSTIIRERLLAHLSVDGLVPERVQQHIEQHRLYRSPIPTRRAADLSSHPAAGRLHGED